MPEYPAAERQSVQLFALHWQRALLLDSQATKTIGRDGVLFAILIVSKEDQLKFAEPPAFWRSELMRLMGYRSPKDFQRMRDKTVKTGLVRYEKGNRENPARYWVLEPKWLKFQSSRKGTSPHLQSSRKGTEPGTEPGTHSIPIPNPKKKPAIERSPEVSEQHWDDWLAVRKSKNAGPVTATALGRIQSEAAKAGITLDKAIEIAAGRSWVSFSAEWIVGVAADARTRQDLAVIANERKRNR